MKTLLATLITLLAATASTQAHCGNCATDGKAPSEHAHHEAACTDTQLAIYFEAQASLANDDLGAAQTASNKLLAMADEKGCSLDGKSCCSAELSAAFDISEAADIAAARLAFQSWSNTLIAKVEESGLPHGDAYQMHCSMAFKNKGGAWLQASKDLRNPYWGSTMLHCGSLQKEHKAQEH